MRIDMDFRPRRWLGRAPAWPWAAWAIGITLSMGAVRLARPSRAMPAHASREHRLANLEMRARMLQIEADSVGASYLRNVQPLVHELRRYSDDDTLVARIAVALLREGRRSGVDPRLLASVLLVEDPLLDPRAVSPQGAVGLMQVMPLHAGSWGCGSDDLTDPDSNICHGARILAHYIRLEHGDLNRALLRYNGCVHGSNTSDCERYPLRVYDNERLALAWRPGAPDAVR